MLSACRRVLLVGFCLFGSAVTYAKDFNWPLTGEIDLSSGFGDYRDGRFHTGVDVRTGGAVGLPVYSPVDGYVWRIKTSYYGYGKGLYVKGQDGYIYVYGHLSAYAPAIDMMVKRSQLKAEKYALDFTPPADSVPVRKGALIAYTGQSGSGAPHLHFEKRLTDEYPLNPLDHGFAVSDRVRPTLARVGFQLTDDHSLFAHGKRQRFLPVKPGKEPGKYVLDGVPCFNSPFGVLIDGFDQARAEGMKQSIPFLNLSVDGKPAYISRFDTLSFAAGKSVYFEYDYAQAKSGEAHVRRLFHLVGDDFAGSRWLDSSKGIFGSTPQRLGKHTATIAAEDCFGNKTELTFDFIWCPQTPLMTLDSTVHPTFDTARFYFSPTAAYDSLQVDSSSAQFGYRENWENTPSIVVHKLPRKNILVQVQSSSMDVTMLRLIHHCPPGGWVFEQPFNGLVKNRYPKMPKISYVALDDGLLVDLESGDGFGCDIRLDLFGDGKVVKRVSPSGYFGSTEYHFFVPPSPELRIIDSMGVSPTENTTDIHSEVTRCTIRAVGYSEADTVSMDPLFAAVFKKDDLFQPRFVALDKLILPRRALYKMNTDAYRLLPEDFPTKQSVSLRLFMNVPNDKSYLNGLCRFDFEKNRWQWRPDSRFSSDTLNASTLSGGVFAAVSDNQAPDIKDLSMQPNQIVSDSRPRIQFILKDTLSGIDENRGIDIRLDRQWQIPEWDPETGICTVQPLDPLREGDHHLAIKVTDRAGNLAQEYRIFTVKKSAPKK